MKPSMFIDVGYISFTYCLVPTRDQILDRYMEMGSLLCFDSERNIRKEQYDWYKANRGANLPAVTQDLKRIAHAWQEEMKMRYITQCAEYDGLEADDVIAINLKDNPSAYVMTRDHDFLQLRDAYLVDKHMERWTVTRLSQKSLYLEQGERYLTYQLLHGCSTDTVPRTLFSKDRYTAPWVFQQQSPLRAALSVLGDDVARQSLDVLLMPTPLYTNEDSIQAALARYPEV